MQDFWFLYCSAETGITYSLQDLDANTTKANDVHERRFRRKRSTTRSPSMWENVVEYLNAGPKTPNMGLVPFEF